MLSSARHKRQTVPAMENLTLKRGRADAEKSGRACKAGIGVLNCTGFLLSNPCIRALGRGEPGGGLCLVAQ